MDVWDPPFADAKSQPESLGVAPGDSSTCHDFAIGPDKALYVSDTSSAKVFRLPAGVSSAELFLELGGVACA